MMDSGFTEADIVSTLTDFKLSPDEIQSYLREARGGSASAVLPGSNPPGSFSPSPIGPANSFRPGPVSSAPIHPVAQQAAAVMTEQLSGVFEQQAAHQGAVQTALDTHGAALSSVEQRMADMHEKVSDLHATISASDLEGADTKQRLAKIEAQLSEIKADQSAVKLLLQKVLESERKILDRMD